MIQSMAVYKGFLVPRLFLDAILKDHIFGLTVFSYLRASFTYKNLHLFASSGINRLIFRHCLPARNFRVRNNQEIVSGSCLTDWATKPTAVVGVSELLLKNQEHHPKVYLISFGSVLFHSWIKPESCMRQPGSSLMLSCQVHPK